MDFYYTVLTSKTIDEAIASIEQNLKENKFGILWRLNLTETLQEKGVNSFKKPYQILEVCNPVEAARVIAHNPLVGYFLPCKITVYEEEGKTKIGLPKPTAMIGLLNDAELISIAEEIEGILIDVLEKSK
ncbi:DUF302 domain-containing protein [Sporosarcina pasteurii]|uniref:Uncharacterized conserved protein n=1 Tax=Sporosarcina pasteurii TaxID=1474 RepID=A0A380C9F9_SPOPA|nr:DUF302 domain-containing protein [Sporosarcina pasteurii]MDS9472981.1 DUF302 domain-containing protein [Sporosarcina pasteurii]QBQ04497.1 DUF302 domain-containing protein [Sporosarcina pasteurii]SUJ14475.1 Uncharacterized conserved protein [Sporosarcina pasteurii]